MSFPETSISSVGRASDLGTVGRGIESPNGNCFYFLLPTKALQRSSMDGKDSDIGVSPKPSSSSNVGGVLMPNANGRTNTLANKIDFRKL